MKISKKIKILVFLCAFITLFAINEKVAFATNNADWVLDKKEELQLPNKIWSISFTTQLDNKTINSKNIYVLDSEGKKLDNIELKYEKDINTVKVIPTKEYMQGKTYFLCIEKGLKSIQDRPISNLHKVEFKIKVIDSDFFKIRNIDCISSKMINVYFTQPINKEAELPLYYEISRGKEIIVKGSYPTLQIKTMDGVNNGVTIYLKDQRLDSNGQYSLKIYGDLMSDFGSRLLNGTGEQVDFSGSDKDNEEIKVVEAQAINDTTLKITFNKPADKETLSRLENYSLKEINGIIKVINKVTVNKDSKSVTVNTATKLKEAYEYELSVKGIKDNFNLSTIKVDKYKVMWDGSQGEGLHVVDVVAVDNKTLNVYFNSNLNKDTATNVGLYKIQGVSISSFADTPRKVYYNQEQTPNMVKLYLNKELKGNNEYKITISPYLKDELGNSVPTNDYYQFVGSDEKHLNTYIDNAVIIGNDTVKVTFNGEILKGGTNLNANNYVLECNQGDSRKIIITCSGVNLVNDNTLILKFENLNFDESYSLKINSIMNITGENDTTYANGIGVTMGKE
ncbi:hypothetical protein LGK97_06985 [Clostridium sp. CS001]|uniref:hypothetical protein n=1 Tax=Clostridium sp. CS001 TaxID=2880648 RepID=UPI001CF29913|nr:hypothetical protein [Clostridium sp. CS001]MCB2289510.1 hypothetical protein [Clostridium sp. CS001]